MLQTLVYLLAAAVICVPLARKLGFGSILGYLAAGMIIGPWGLRLVTDVGEIAHISEFGVLMLLFLVGLEIRPRRMWLMRRAVFGFGLAQVVVTAALLAALLVAAGFDGRAALVLGVGAALSSTAIALPLLAERDLLNISSGRDTFAVLLFQDLATVPLVAALPLLGDGVPATGSLWVAVLKAVLAVAAILGVGRLLVRPMFRAIGGVQTREVFTMLALLLVVGAAGLTGLAGLPMSLGAFAAGMILSESEYRHELQADIEPFEGVLLGFFFLTIGMTADLGLLVAEPLPILGAVAAMLVGKVGVVALLQRLRGRNGVVALRTALALPQGSEFGFVLFGAALAVGVLPKAALDHATLVIGVSMALGPVLFAASERLLIPRLQPGSIRPDEPVDVAPAPVIICGFGRFGQVVGRVLKSRRIRFNAIDPDPDNIDIVRRFGSKAFYGDPTRTELLRAVGAAEAKVLVIALPDMEQSLKVATLAKADFPNLRIYARVRNRRHAHRMLDLEVAGFVRELFFSSVRLTELVLGELGFSEEEARHTVEAFRAHDTGQLLLQHPIYEDERRLIQTAREAAEELRSLFESDDAEASSF